MRHVAGTGSVGAGVGTAGCASDGLGLPFRYDVIGPSSIASNVRFAR